MGAPDDSGNPTESRGSNVHLLSSLQSTDSDLLARGASNGRGAAESLNQGHGDKPSMSRTPAEPPPNEANSLDGDEAPSKDASTFKRFRYLLKKRPLFRYLWFASIISSLGDFFNWVALITLVVSLTDKQLAVAAVLVVETMPIFLFSGVAGVVADRFDRTTIMLMANSVATLACGGFILAHRLEALWLVYVCAIFLFVSQAFFMPALQGLKPTLVTSEELGLANTLDGMSFSVMLAVAAALGGVVTSLWGVDVCFILNALTFLSSFRLLFLIRKGIHAPDHVPIGQVDRKPAASSTPASAQVVWSEDATPSSVERRGSVSTERLLGDAEQTLAEDDADDEQKTLDPADEDKAATHGHYARLENVVVGADKDEEQEEEEEEEEVAPVTGCWDMYKSGLAYLWEHRDLLWLAGFKAIGNMTLGAFETAGIRLTQSDFALSSPSSSSAAHSGGHPAHRASHDSSLSLGLMWACIGVGCFIGCRVALLYDQTVPRDGRLAIGHAYTAEFVGGLLVVWSPHFVVFLLGVMVVWAGDAVVYVCNQTCMQLGSTDAYRGRVFAFVFAMRTLTYACSTVVMGLLIDDAHWSPRQSMSVFLFLMVANVLLFYSVYFPRYLPPVATGGSRLSRFLDYLRLITPCCSRCCRHRQGAKGDSSSSGDADMVELQHGAYKAVPELLADSDSGDDEVVL